MTQKKKKSLKEIMEKEGWVFEQYRCYKKVGDKEIDIEFCIGDFCTGIYDKYLELLEPKKSCRSFLEGLVTAKLLEEKYKV